MISATPPKHFHLFSPPSWLDSKSIFPVNQPKSSEWSLALYFQLSSGASPLPMLYPESRDHLLLLVFFRSLLSGLSASTYSLSYTEPSWPTKSKSIRLYHFFFLKPFDGLSSSVIVKAKVMTVAKKAYIIWLELAVSFGWELLLQISK